MNVVSVLQLIVASLFGIALLYASYSDLKTFIIPNAISIFLVVLFAVAYVLVPGTGPLINHLGAAVLVFLVGFALFGLGLFGGGDVKLWASVALWFGFDQLPVQVAFVILAGGALGIGLFAIRLVLAQDRVVAVVGLTGALPRVLQVGEAVPYGVAIAIGSILAFRNSPFFPGLAL